jgi:hypothetical protein
LLLRSSYLPLGVPNGLVIHHAQGQSARHKQGISTPPDPGVRLLNGGRTRRRLPRPVPRRRGWQHRTRASGEKRGCLGACWGWCASIRVLGGGFYRPEGRGQGRPVGGRRRVFWRRAQARPGTAALLACWRGSISATECCGSALARSRRSATCREEEGQRGGGPGGVFPLLPCRTAWVGAEGAGLDRGGLHEHGYRLEMNGNSGAHSDLIFSDFCSPGVRSNARKKLRFEFLKFFTLGGQHIRQGFQGYFCSQEITCFAKICI